MGWLGMEQAYGIVMFIILLEMIDVEFSVLELNFWLFFWWFKLFDFR